MVQSVWSTAHGHPLQITGLRGDQVSRLGAHFDPILAAVRAALARLAEPGRAARHARRSRSRSARCPSTGSRASTSAASGPALGFALAYLAYPPTQWLTLNEFHPVALACPLLLFAIWFLDEGRLLPFALCAAVAATTKEEIALVVAGLGIWYALAHHRRWTGARDRGGRRGGRAGRDRGRDPALQPRRHLELLHALQPGRQHAGRDRPHRADRPLEDRHDRLHRPRARLPRAACCSRSAGSRCSRR